MVNIGEVELTGVNVRPREVTPGGTVRIDVSLTETAEVVGPFGQLRLCDPDGFNPTGLEIDVVFESGWTQNRRDTVCVPVSNIGSYDYDLTYTLTAPSIPQETEQQSFPFTVRLESTKNNTRSQNVTDNVVVSRGSGAEDEPEEGNGSNGGSGNGNLLTWAGENPGLALGAGVLSIVATRTAIESFVGGD